MRRREASSLAGADEC